MTSNNDQSTSSDTNNNNINDSSYHLKIMSFEDSQIDHFIPYSSPSILYWQTNRKLMKSHNSDFSKANMSDIEQARGHPSDLSSSNLVQIHAENTLELTAKPSLINQNKHSKNSIPFDPNDSKILTNQPFKTLDSISIPDFSCLAKDKSSLNELNRSKTLSDLENNIQKRLEFLDLTEQEEIRNEKSDSKIPAIEVEFELKNRSLSDETVEVLKEMLCEEDDDELEEEPDASKSDTLIDPDIEYYKLIDEKLDEMKKKKIELLQDADKPSTKSANFKKSLATVSWEISPNVSKSSKKNRPSNKENLRETSLSYNSEISFDTDKNEILKSLKRNAAFESTSSFNSNKFNQLNDFKNFINNPIKTLIENKNCLNEVSTQTSFLEPNCSNKSNKKQTVEEMSNKSPLNQIKFDTIQQKKFRHMIDAQKHEKRYKELELLAKLERLQAERLKKLMLESDSDSSSFFCDSYFQQQKTSSSYLDKDGSLDNDRLEQEIHKYKTKQTIVDKNRRKSEFVKPNTYPRLKNFDDLSLISEADSTIESRLSFNNVKKSKVEVLHLKDTTIHQAPRGVFVIKENEGKNVPKQTEKDRRVMNSNNFRNPIKSVQSDPVFKNFQNLPEHGPRQRVRTVSNKNVEVLKEDENVISSFNKMSLQEAFKIFRQDLIVRSQNRLKEIEERSQIRHEQAQLERKSVILSIKLKQAEKKLSKQNSLSTLSWVSGQINQNQIQKFDFSSKRRMSSQEIKNLTRKNYEKLPEVKEKQQKEKLQQSKRLNLIKTSIYKKTIQQHVLARGTNFDLNYKALEN